MSVPAGWERTYRKLRKLLLVISRHRKWFCQCYILARFRNKSSDELTLWKTSRNHLALTSLARHFHRNTWMLAPGRDSSGGEQGKLTLDKLLVSHPIHQDNQVMDWHNKTPCINPVSINQPQPAGGDIHHSSFPDHGSTQRDNEYQVSLNPSWLHQS